MKEIKNAMVNKEMEPTASDLANVSGGFGGLTAMGLMLAGTAIFGAIYGKTQMDRINEYSCNQSGNPVPFFGYTCE